MGVGGSFHWPDQEAVPRAASCRGAVRPNEAPATKKGSCSRVTLRAQSLGPHLPREDVTTPAYLDLCLSWRCIHRDDIAERNGLRSCKSIPLVSTFPITHWGTGHFQKTPAPKRIMFMGPPSAPGESGRASKEREPAGSGCFLCSFYKYSLPCWVGLCLELK